MSAPPDSMAMRLVLEGGIAQHLTFGLLKTSRSQSEKRQRRSVFGDGRQLCRDADWDQRRKGRHDRVGRRCKGVLGNLDWLCSRCHWNEHVPAFEEQVRKLDLTPRARFAGQSNTLLVTGTAGSKWEKCRKRERDCETWIQESA